jgi:hypothetical protein
MIAVAGVPENPTTRNAAEMPPFREVNLAVAFPIVILLRDRRALRPVRLATIVCRMEEPEDCGAKGSSNQEPVEQRLVRI